MQRNVTQSVAEAVLLEFSTRLEKYRYVVLVAATALSAAWSPAC